ncbi:hypothetical protein QBC45DRAFT_206327 [Copromyces sp. CBS 386.78]|nr:hypothetical protein QBC45DRAFT_206327 [Copromyces sp. CBS 386.78]
MPPGIRTSTSRNTVKYNSAWVLSLLTTSLVQLCLAVPPPANGQPDLSPRGNNNPLNIDWDPAPAPEDGPPLSRGALRDPAYLPAQIGGIVGSYALSLVIVAILLLVLSKGRRQALINADLPDQDKYLNFNPLPAYLQQTEEEFKQTLAQFHGHEQGQQFLQQQQEQGQVPPPLPTLQIPQSPYRNWGFREGPLSASRSQHSIISAGSPTSTILAAGYDLSVDQTVIQHDRAMAQQQLEEMYKHVMEQEEAKAEGREYIPPYLPRPSVSSFASQQQPQHQQAPATPGTMRKNKPSNLNLSKEKEEKQSRGASLLNFLKSPKKNKAPQGLSISSPIMTPMSATFPRGYHPDVDGAQEMNPIPPRHYAPAKPPPIPSDVLPFRRQNSGGQAQYPTPDISPVSTQSIDQRIDIALHRPPTRGERGERQGARSDERLPSHVRDTSAASNASSLTGDAYLADPPSAVSERSTSGLVSGSGTVGLPSSPRPGANRFPSLDSTRTLPSSPKPGASFSSSTRSGVSGGSSLRANAPAPLGSMSLNGNGNASSSAVRAGGALPLRAYEPSLASPTSGSQTTKQTVFTRQVNGPLSPGMSTAGLRTPWTGAPVPYSPYQPFSPVVPITPSLVTKADRKRMKRFEPKTPTVEMVRSEEDIW